MYYCDSASGLIFPGLSIAYYLFVGVSVCYNNPGLNSTVVISHLFYIIVSFIILVAFGMLIVYLQEL